MPTKKKTKKSGNRKSSAKKASPTKKKNVAPPVATTAEPTPIIIAPVPSAPPVEAPEFKAHQFTHTGDEVLILRRVEKNRISKKNFVYPKGVGQVVIALDWNTNQKCGGGLHGWPWGLGLGDGMDYQLDDDWLVLGAKPEDVIGELENGWKCKCRTATIRYDGHFAGAMAMIRDGFHKAIQLMAKVEINPATLASGYYSQLAASGKNSVAAVVGKAGRVKVGENGVFAISYFISEEQGWGIAVGKVGVDGIKPDTWYETANGKIVESPDQS
ncbi:MAG: hypothetical protein LBK99_16545 [Opitutaceae bacterium]|jgi:hypothetical protein|nr:hypothetical protein [Opitutaceae bacterium]